MLGNPIIVPHETTLDLYRKMLTVFFVEERMKVFVKQGKCSFLASTRGHEKVQIGMTMLLRPGFDWFFPYYRSKALAIGLGMPPKNVFLGMLSREGDPNSNGRNMAEHFSSRELNLVSQTAVTATQYLNAVGAARAFQLEGEGRIAYVSSGEGATSEGEFFEALNWAGREKLPVVFLVQNNGYAISVPQAVQTGSEVHRIAQGFGIRTFHLDGTSFESIYEQLPPAIEAVRQGVGPILVEAEVVRLDPHSSSDDHRRYRSSDELASLSERDPILRTERYLIRNGVLTPEEAEAFRSSIKTEVDQAAAEADGYPHPSTGNLLARIYSEEPQPAVVTPKHLSGKPIAMIDAINHGLREEMERNPSIQMWGEDIADAKGAFSVLRADCRRPSRNAYSMRRWPRRVSPASQPEWRSQGTNPSLRFSSPIIPGLRSCNFATKSPQLDGAAKVPGSARWWCGSRPTGTSKVAPGTRPAWKEPSPTFRAGAWSFPVAPTTLRA